MAHIENQRGAVLFVALIFLLLTAVIASTVMQTSIQEVRMAANEQFKEEAFQQSQALTNAISADEKNFGGDEVVGYTICPAGASGCNEYSLTVPTAVTQTPAGVSLTYRLTRMAPLVSSLPFRLGESSASSSSKYGVRFYEAMGQYDGRDKSLGWSEVHQGLGQRIGTGSSAYY